MGDHFVLLVDQVMPSVISQDNIVIEFCSQRSDVDVDSTSLNKLVVECRICHDEDEDTNMETPCSCSGTLQYAHRKCVQRWSNEKGATICEICCKQFKPGYTVAPPSLYDYGDTPMNFRRGNWEASGMDVHNSPFIAMFTADYDFDHYSYSTPISTTSLICCQIIAVTFIALLILRPTLPVILYGTEESLTLFTVLMLRTIGILVPIFLMVKAYSAIQQRRHQHSQQVD